MACSLHAEDVKTPDTEQSLYKLKLLWSREFPDKIYDIQIAPDGQQCVVSTYEGKAGSLHMLDEFGKNIWEKKEVSNLHFKFLNNTDIVSLSSGLDGNPRALSYYNRTGKEIWKHTVDTEPFFVGSEGKYIGYSGILNTYEQSCMDWWELRDKDFNLLWQYRPEHNIDATLLSDGKTLMVEGREVKLYGKGGQELKKVVIPEILSHPISYQGCVNPTTSMGPEYLKGTQDGRYAVFYYSSWNDELKDNFGAVYSVDMKKGTWWSYRTEKDAASTKNLYLSNDGKYLLVHEYYEALLFDNMTGELLWKDETGKGFRQLERADILMIDNSLYVLLNWVPGFVDESTRRKWNYFVDINTGKRLKLFESLIFSLEYGGDSDNCEQSGKYVLEQKGKRINKYLIIPGEDKR